MKRKIYQLNNLNCAHCAGLIDEELKKIENLKDYSLNFATKELKVSIEDKYLKNTIEKITETILRIENVVEIVEKDIKELKFKLENLFCQSCSQKIENLILKLDEVNDGFYNFSTQILVLNVNAYTNTRSLKDNIQNIVDSVEKGVKVISLNENTYDIKEENDSYSENKTELILNIVGMILFFILISLKDVTFKIPLFLIAYFLVGSDILLSALKNLKNKNPFDENFLMTIATVGAFAIGEYPEAVAVMIFYKVGEYFQSKAVTKSRKSIKELLNIKPEWANIEINGLLTKVKPSDISVGEIIIVNPGENIPLDGKIVKGRTSLDTKALTGESLPVDVKVNDNILSGCTNISSTIELKVTKDYTNSTVTKILDLVENASIKKAKTEKFITIFSKYYTPIIVGLSLFVGIILPLFIGNFDLWFYRALIFLVISCPCALVVSIPLGYFGGIGKASSQGILIKGSSYLESLSKVNKIILDKTGTLTKGTFVIENIHFTTSKEELMETAVIGESGSNHPIAMAIKNNYSYIYDRNQIKSFEVIQGYGTKTIFNDSIIFIGNKKFIESNKINLDNNIESSTVVHVAIDNKYLGYILLSDEIREDSKIFIEKAKSKGVELIMLSGDNYNTCNNVAKFLGINKFFHSLLPEDKVKLVEKELENNKGTTIFVGDGINDAPVLKRVDIGISMGGVGTDAAIEASDIVIMDDKLEKIIKAIDISKKTKKIIIQNIIFAITIKVVVLILGLEGYANMWEAIFADVGVALIAVFNSIRVLKN